LFTIKFSLLGRATITVIRSRFTAASLPTRITNHHGSNIAQFARAGQECETSYNSSSILFCAKLSQGVSIQETVWQSPPCSSALESEFSLSSFFPRNNNRTSLGTALADVMARSISPYDGVVSLRNSVSDCVKPVVQIASL
jgi:hypothetical protein